MISDLFDLFAAQGQLALLKTLEDDQQEISTKVVGGCKLTGRTDGVVAAAAVFSWDGE
jgi:hypothetical protein